MEYQVKTVTIDVDGYFISGKVDCKIGDVLPGSGAVDVVFSEDGFTVSGGDDELSSSVTVKPSDVYWIHGKNNNKVIVRKDENIKYVFNRIGSNEIHLVAYGMYGRPV